MSNIDILKCYSLEIDFLDYNKKENISRNIVYSEGDINTAFIDAKLTIGGEKIELNDCVITISIKNNRGKNLSNTCKILNEQEGLIRIPFNKSFLSKIGFNKFEIIIYKKDKKLVSPTYVYRVTESFTDNEGIDESENYDILLVLISQVQEVIDDAQEATNNVREIEREIHTNEEARKINELQRIENEKTREINEDNRQTQEDYRQDVFNKKVTEINELTNRIGEKLTQLDEDVENTINTKFDSKVEEVDAYIDTTINRNIKKVEDKISEVDIVKTQLINEVNVKITEVDTVKTDLTNSIDNKMVEFEDRFNDLETSNPVGEIVQSRTSIDGNTHESLSKRLQYDYEKKADSDTVYTKSEIDTKIKSITPVDDSNISTKATWSSSKINSELEKKETVEGVQTKIEQTIRDSKTYTDERVANLIGQSPELLDTLEELSRALGNDPNFATTITNQIGQKADKSSVYSKEEVDRIVSTSTSIDDENISRLTTWSSEKIQEEISNKTIHWDSIIGRPTSFNPSEHNHNNIYYQKNETDTLLEPIDNNFIDGLFTNPSTKINGVRYYSAKEIDKKINVLISMIEKLSK